MAARFLHCSLPVLWAIKRRRTDRRRTEPPQSPFPPSQDEEDCILGLLMLSRAPLVLHGGAPKQQPVLLPRSSPPATTRKGELYPISFPGLTPFLPPLPPEQNPSAPAPKKQDQKLLPPPPPEQERSLLSSPVLKQQRQKEPLPPPTPSTDDLLRYKCSECGKAFSSFQALGGHKSSHYRKRPSPSPLPEKQRRVKARRALAMPSASPTECSPKKGQRIDLKINQPLMEID